MRVSVLVAAVVVAAPLAAQSPAFHVQVACDGPMPVGMGITATRPGAIVITLEELFSFCALNAPAGPTKQRWKGST